MINNLHQIILPKSELLKKYIVSFNVLNKFEQPKSIIYHAFPQRGTTIGVFENSQIEIDKKEIIISKNPSNPKIIFLGKYLRPLKIKYKGHVKKISIHFTETGINYFFPNYYLTLGKNDIQIVNASDLSIDSNILFSKNVDERINYLEAYLLDKFNTINIKKIEAAIKLLSKNPSLQTKELAQQIFMNEKTLNRQFKKYVGCTTTEFKHIIRFKKTTEDYFNTTHKNLIQLCYDNDYYDASHFYKQITKTTNFNPKKFFKNIQKMGLENHIYILE